MPSLVQITATKSGDASGRRDIGPLTLTNSNTIPTPITLDFAAVTTLQVAIPAAATGMVILPPADNTLTVKIHAGVSDTGILIAKNRPTVFSAFAGGSSLYITVSSTSSSKQWAVVYF